MKINELPLINIEDCFSYLDICRKLNISIKGNNFKKIKEYIEYHSLSIEHFKKRINPNTKYKQITKACPVCKTEFNTGLGSPKEQTVCSRSCSNTYFRSGKNNPNWRNSNYRTTCFHYHKKECIVCNEKNIVEVHHYDEDHNNNDPKNLIPLCPTHHQYYHSKYKHLITDKINEYYLNYNKLNP